MNPNMQGPGEGYLQGEWQQDSTAVQKQLVTYSLYHFTFTCDSFFVKQQTFSKVNYGVDTCMNKGRWTEYIRGTYAQKLDTLHLKGVFCNADYSLKVESGCFRMGVYEEYFKITQKNRLAVPIFGHGGRYSIEYAFNKKINMSHQTTMKMKISFFKKLAVGVALLYTPLLTMAWGTEGHRVCGQIADSYLTPRARAAIQAILGNESIALASNWADFIKSDTSYRYLSSWHYVDFDKAYTYPEMQAFLTHDTNVDAYTKLEFLIGELKKKDLSAANKLLYLRMVIHIVEDVHQPLHTGHTADKGGNDVKVTWQNNPTNLHSVWDSDLINFQQLSYTEYAAAINHTTAEERAEWQKAPISQWLFESNQLAEKIYADVPSNGNLRSYDYNFKYIGITNQQLLKGGVRLAGILNQIFG